MLNSSFKIDSQEIATDEDPYIIAEIGSNFNQSLDTAKRLIDVACEAGANAAKFQLFSAEELYPKDHELYPIFKANELSSDWIQPLQEHCVEQRITFMASAFDLSSIRTLRDHKVSAFKIASSETTNLGLVFEMAKSGQPLIISTGMCDLSDVVDAIAVCEAAGNTSIALLQCAAVYPAPAEDLNLRAMALMQSAFGCPVGFSDHSMGIAAAIASIGAGATVYERHITLDRNSEGPDHFYAMEPNEFEALIKNIREAASALGQPVKDLLQQEREAGRREGLYLSKSLPAGHIISETDIRIARPAVGIRARFMPVVLGQKLIDSADKDEALQWQMIRETSRDE